MAAMAHGLDVKLGKRKSGQTTGWLYVLNPAGRLPDGEDVAKAILYARTAGYVAAAAAAVARWLEAPRGIGTTSPRVAVACT
jgi:cobalamin biosynthesis protein CobD/CbiB